VTGDDLRGLGVDVAAGHGGGVGAPAGVKVGRQSRICFDEQLTLSRRVEPGVLLNEDSSGIVPNREGETEALAEFKEPEEQDAKVD
jgi:hypothetical protein